MINATAIGSRATVKRSNAIVLGSIQGKNGAGTTVNVGIGTDDPRARFHTIGEARVEGRMGINYANTIGGTGNVGVLALSGVGGNMHLSMISNTSTSRFSFQATSTRLRLYYNTSHLGGFNSSNGIYLAASDRRLKGNIQPLGSVLDKVKKVEIMNYTFKRDETQREQIGYIAQELEKQFPEFVYEPMTEDGNEANYTVDYAGMSAVAIKAIQEQQQIIQNQEDEIDAMRILLEDLEVRISLLEE